MNKLNKKEKIAKIYLNNLGDNQYSLTYVYPKGPIYSGTTIYPTRQKAETVIQEYKNTSLSKNQLEVIERKKSDITLWTIGEILQL